MPKTIQELRKEAGYRSGREFAAALGVSPSTYSRYEASPESIPLKAAWAMADILGCSIDMIVGREHVEVSDMRGEVQKLYDALTPQSRYLMDDYMEYLTMRDKAAEKRRQEEEDQRYRAYAEYYERLFLQEVEDSSEFGAMFGSGSDAQSREAFERFITERARQKREADIERDCIEQEISYSTGSEYYVYDDQGEVIGYDQDEPVKDENELAELMRKHRETITETWEARDKEVIEKIMRAYDRIHAQVRLPLFDRSAVTIEYSHERIKP